MHLITIFFTSFLVGLSGAMMPGPVLTLTITETMTEGPRSGILLIVGHAILELLMFFGFVYIGLHLFLQNDIVIRTIGILGGAYLLWMGITIIKDVWGGELSVEIDSQGRGKSSKLGSTVKGALVSLSNPAFPLWWATIGAKFVIESLKYGKTGLSFFYTGHILSDFLWYGLVIGAVVSGKKIFTSKAYKIILLVCGIFLIILAGVFILNIEIF